MPRRAAAALLAGLWLGGCAFPDGPGRPISAPRDIPDAVPRSEPPSRYGNPERYTVFGRTYRTLERADGYRERGIASWYGRKFHGRRTSSGEPYDMYAMTAAHRSLPLPTYVRVTHLGSGRQVVVRVNDRGPFVNNRLIDLSYAAASKLGMTETGTAPVEVEALAAAGPAKAASAPVVPPAEAAGVRYFLQVGAFSKRGNALALLQRLERTDLDAPVSLSRNAGSDGLYRVRLGPLADVAAVDRVSARLGAHGIADAHVVVEE
mgnify:CR=1 FL=1